MYTWNVQRQRQLYMLGKDPVSLEDIADTEDYVNLLHIMCIFSGKEAGFCCLVLGLCIMNRQWYGMCGSSSVR